MLPLSSVRVLDLTQYVAGPVATHVLAQLGAEVIKVESPTGDPARRGMGLTEESEPYPLFVGLHRHKSSVVIDLQTDGGRDLLLELVRVSDAVVENFRPGVIQKLRLEYSDLKAVNPLVIYCSISAFGRTGPMANVAATDGPIQAYAGVMSIHGGKDESGEPAPPYFVNMADVSAGLFAANGILAALLHRQRAQEGCYLDVSLFESILQLIPREVHIELQYGALAPPRLQGGLPPLRTSDGKYVVVQIPYPRHQERFSQIVSQVASAPEIQHERFSTAEARAKNADEYLTLVQSAFRRVSSSDWVLALGGAGLPVAPINSLAEALANPQLAHRGTLIPVDVPVRGRIHSLGLPIQFSYPPEPDAAERPPFLGEHTRQVLERVLGYSPARIDDLAIARAIQAE